MDIEPYTPPNAELISPSESDGSDELNEPLFEWETRTERGALAALALSLRRLTLHPVKAFRGMKKKGDFASPILWALMFMLPGVVYGIFSTLGSEAPLPILTRLLGLPESSAGLEKALSVFFIIFGAPIGLLIESFAVHFLAMMGSGRAKSSSDLSGTVRALAYPLFLSPISFLPVGGALAGWLVVGLSIWTFGLKIIGLRTIHNMSILNSALALLLPWFIYSVVFFIGMGAFAIGASAL